MNCVVEDYIKYVENFLVSYYKILLGEKYERSLVKPFVDKYIDTRYYNNSIIKDGTFLSKINKELKRVANEYSSENEAHIEKIKNIFALFGYVLYLDDCAEYSSLSVLLDSLLSDENIKLEYDENTKNELRQLVKEFTSKKKEFFHLFDNDEFTLDIKRIKRKLYHVDLKQNCKISKLYSDYAIDKAYNSENVIENRIHLMAIMLSEVVLENIMKLDFATNYVIDIPSSILTKPNKFNRVLRALDSDSLKSNVHLRVTYADYRDNKEIINNLIKKGYSVALLLDEHFIDDYEIFVLFSYIFVYEKYEYYDMIIDDDSISKDNIITL